jgi:ubiquinone/menaquinone biosynthesis C-methylase UbiE
METEAARAYLEGLIRGATDYTHILAGMKAGIFDALARSGPAGSSAADLAATLGYREDYVRIWCETAFALGVLDDGGDRRFRLADGFEALLTSGPPPASVTGAFRLHEQWVRERLELAEVIQTGEDRPRSDVTDDREHAAAMATYTRPLAQVRTERIYLQIPAVADRLRQGGRLLDVGCGVGTQVESLAQAFPTATFVGIDVLAPVLEVARELIAAGGLSDRVTFLQTGAEQLEAEEAFDVIMMNIVLHELPPAIRPRAVTAMYRASRPGGVLISNDFLYPNRRAEFRTPEYALGVFDQALELAWGSRHLSRDQLQELYIDSGFARCEFVQIPMPFPSLVRPGSQVIYLTALAFK